MKKIELLAPAGSKEAFYAAINNGADAIYMGGKNFSARAFADNFSQDDFIELINYAHLRNVKIYVTVNTLLNEFEFNNAVKDIDFYYTHNIDALLVQDLGLYYYIKRNYPDFEIHASTQMHIHNVEGVKTCKKLGFNRVVLARESSLDLIKEATKQDIEIETFVHGAICVSYSGQCLLSSSIKNRSANKGMCAQCCRLKYELLDEENNKIKTDTDYLLSPKDMFLLNDIPSLIEAGVSSLKIEGRMKSSAYVGYVTKVYRKAIDSYYEGKEYEPTKQIINNLKVLFNRGYTNTFLKGSKEDIFNQTSPNHQGIKIGEVISSNGNRVKIKLSNTLNQFDGVRIYSNVFDDGFIVNKLYLNGKLANHALNNDIIELESSHMFKKGDLLLKTLDKNFEDEINSSTSKYLPLDLRITINENNPVVIETNGFKYVSSIKASKAINAPLNYENVKKQFSKLKETPYYLNNLKLECNNSFLRVSELNEIRNEFINKYNEYRLNIFERKANSPLIDLNKAINSNKETKDIMKASNKFNQYVFTPVINVKSEYPDDNIVVTEMGGLLNNHQKIAYYTLNVSNSYAYEFLNNLGFNAICLSTELNTDQVLELIKEYKNRNKEDIKPYILYEGKRTLMFIKNNPFAKYKNAKYLKDQSVKLEIIENIGYTELKEKYHTSINTDKVSKLIND